MSTDMSTGNSDGDTKARLIETLDAQAPYTLFDENRIATLLAENKLDDCMKILVDYYIQHNLDRDEITAGFERGHAIAEMPKKPKKTGDGC